MAVVGRWQICLFSKCRSRARFAASGRLNLCTRAVAGEWEGLQAWRLSSVDERRVWGPKNTSKEPPPIVTSSLVHIGDSNASLNSKYPSCLAEWGALVLNTSDPLLKASITHHAFRLWSNHQLPLGVANAPNRPARPEKPPLKQVDNSRANGKTRKTSLTEVYKRLELLIAMEKERAT
ncbi:hypothetical protein L7F22_036551 [Adiantum nelumboides]|nr:hypothetical protein [Adiantum nelumboides]